MITKFKIYENFRDKLPKQNWKMDMVDKAIDKINKNTETITYRKSDKFINNLLLNSELGINYRKHYKLQGENVKKLPVTKEIYKHEQLIKNIQSLFGECEKLAESKFKDNAKMVDMILERLIELIIVYSYFPASLDYPNKGFKERRNTTFYEEMNRLFDGKKTIKEIFKDVYHKDSMISHALFFADSDDDVRAIFKLIEELESSNSDYDLIQKRYKKYNEIHISRLKEYSWKIEAFNDFLEDWEYSLKHSYGDVSITTSGSITGSQKSMFNKDEKKARIEMVFTGDFDKDYKKYQEVVKSIK